MTVAVGRHGDIWNGWVGGLDSTKWETPVTMSLFFHIDTYTECLQCQPKFTEYN